MKKLILLIAAVAIMLPSCGKINEELDELRNRIDKLEQEAIPSIDEQIAAINTSLDNFNAMDVELKGYIDGLTATASNLQEQINSVNTKIGEVKAELKGDIASTNSELKGEIATAKADVLAQLEALENELKTELAQINATIATLQAKDTELEGKITELRTYVDTELGKTTDWVNATFATLKQYNSLVSEVATIKEQIKAINESVTNLETKLTTKINEDIATAVSTLSADIQQKVSEITTAYTNAVKTAKEEITTAYTAAIQTAISNLDSSLKAWVGEQLANYYTIAEVEAKIAALQTSMTEGDEALQEELKSLKSQLETTAAEITAAYKKEIEEAINTNNGVIDTKIANEIASVNQRINNEVATINAKIAKIESRLDNVEAKIAELLARIQSVSYIPTYSDGKATVKYKGMTGNVTLDFEVSPKDAVAELAKVWQSAVSVKAVYTQTRAVSFIDMPITKFETDEANGVISVTVSAENLSEDFATGLQEASARLAISDGNSSITSEYIPLCGEELAVFHVDYNSISLHVNWPEDKVKPGNVLKWGYFDLATYNKYIGGAGYEWDMLNLHDDVYHNWFDGDKYFYLNDDNRWVDYEGDKIAQYNAIVAGQPGYFMLGEYAYTTDDSYFNSNWDPGYYKPCFGPNVIGGYFRKVFIESKKPEVMQATPDVKINLTPKGTGTITITPTDDIYMCVYALVDDSVYYGDMMHILGNKTEYIQWFISSETGFYLLSSSVAYAPTTIIAEDMYYLKPNTTYHLCITSYGDEIGSRQSYKKVTFRLPEPTLPNPTCVVTPAELPADTPESEKPFLIAFNIKCPTKDADEVSYVANYERDWESMRTSLKKSGYTTEEADAYLVESYGSRLLSTDELKKVNSDEGYTITFSTREDAVTYLGAICYNSEGSPSPVAVTSARSLKEPARTPTTSPLFESLKDEWHVKAPIQGSRYVDNVLTPFKVYAEFDVTIGDVGYANTLPDYIYDLYYSAANMNKNDVDAVYAQFKTSVDDFNVKNKNQNRLLVQGFDLAQPIEQFKYNFDGESTSITAFRDPY